jgi:hypothetical protein
MYELIYDRYFLHSSITCHHDFCKMLIYNDSETDLKTVFFLIMCHLTSSTITSDCGF